MASEKEQGQGRRPRDENHLCALVSVTLGGCEAGVEMQRGGGWSATDGRRTKPPFYVLAMRAKHEPGIDCKVCEVDRPGLWQARLTSTAGCRNEDVRGAKA
jgi:hypothetical protein